VIEASVTLNYTIVLNISALVFAVLLIWRHFAQWRRPTHVEDDEHPDGARARARP